MKGCLEKCLRWDYTTVSSVLTSTASSDIRDVMSSYTTFISAAEIHPEMKDYNKSLWQCMDKFELAWN